MGRRFLLLPCSSSNMRGGGLLTMPRLGYIHDKADKTLQRRPGCTKSTCFWNFLPNISLRLPLLTLSLSLSLFRQGRKTSTTRAKYIIFAVVQLSTLGGRHKGRSRRSFKWRSTKKRGAGQGMQLGKEGRTASALYAACSTYVDAHPLLCQTG
jgi:hypothetical protein